MKIKQSLSKNLPFLYCNCAYGGRIKCLIRIIYFAFYCFSLVLPSNSPASGCQKRFSNLCRNRQLVLDVKHIIQPKNLFGIASSPRADGTELQRIVRILTSGLPKFDVVTDANY